MKNRAFITALAAAVLTTGLLAGPALAGPHTGHGNGYHSGRYQASVYESLTPEKQKQYDAILKDFMDKTQDLRDKMQAKQIELDTFGNSTNPNPQAVGKASEELVNLRNQFRKERLAMTDRLAKEVGVNASQERGSRGSCPGFSDRDGNGYGHRMMGDGYNGHMGRGYHYQGGQNN